MSKVMVTGAGGYIGSHIVKDLVNTGHEVTAVDRFFFGKEVLAEFANNPKVKIFQKDIRDLTENDFLGHDAVCDLACLSNDPAGELDINLTYQINRDGRIHVAKMAKKAGVKKYVISSSCSVYGSTSGKDLKEQSTTNPISVYAKSTLQAEEQNLSISDNNFSVTSLRNATVFGISNRMRFDLVVNLMTLTAFQKARIIVMGGGSQWRPLIHVSDVSKAFLKVLDAPRTTVNQQIFNIGLDNFQIINLAYLVREQLGFSIEIDVAPDDADKRDYNISFKKAEESLSFKASVDVSQGISEIYSALKSGTLDTGPKTVTVQWYKNILDAKALLDSIVDNGRVI
jgi:nucleoside-diphosphate-sugar epimerase